METKKRILVYGSLRNGEFNFERFKRIYGDELTYLSTTEIKGFDLYDLGSYPGIKLSENTEQPLVVDIMECSPACFNSLNGMELGAGYRAETILLDGVEHTIYVYMGRANKLVESGDWSKYLSHGQETYA